MKALLASLFLLTLAQDGQEAPKEEMPKEKVKGVTFYNRIPTKTRNLDIHQPNAKDSQLQTELHEAAYKIAKYYTDIFVYMDKNVDDTIGVDELKEVYQNHHWPKPPELTDNQMVDYLIEEYGNK